MLQSAYYFYVGTSMALNKVFLNKVSLKSIYDRYTYTTGDTLVECLADGYFAGAPFDLNSPTNPIIEIDARDGDTITAVRLSDYVAVGVPLEILGMPSAADVSASSKKTLFVSGQKTIVLWGDSITKQNLIDDATNTNYSSMGYFNWLNFRLDNSFFILNDAGVSGDTTAEILARFDTDVMAFNPQYVFCLGGTNDLIGSATVAEIKANIQSIVALIRSISAIPILATPPLTVNITRQSDYSTIIEWIKSYCASEKIHCVDFARAWVDVASTTYPYAISGVTYDNLHPNMHGGYLLGKLGAETLESERVVNNFFPSTIANAKNKVTNPFNRGVAGTLSGGATGQLPDNVSLVVTKPASSTIVCSVEQVGNVRTNKIVIDGTLETPLIIRYATGAPAINKIVNGFAKIKSAIATDCTYFALRLRVRDGSTDQITSYTLRNLVAPSGTVPEFDFSGILPLRDAPTDVNTDGYILDIFFYCVTGTIEVDVVCVIEEDA